MNSSAIKEFKLGENLAEVKERICQLIVPVLYIFNHKLEEKDEFVSKTLETALASWCGLLGDAEMAQESSEAVSDILSIILEPSMPKGQRERESRKNREHIDQQVDQGLASKYRAALKKMRELASVAAAAPPPSAD